MNPQMNQKSGAARRPGAQGFTVKQGEYLAFHLHLLVHVPLLPRRSRHAAPFQVTPPSVHQMVLTLERNGLIRRQPGVARSIELLIASEEIPILKWLEINPSNPL
jgi:DNA-binding MarR family transcriptional regulator